MVAKKVLIAEDDPDDRMLFRQFMKERNDIVLLPEAENGVALFQILDLATDVSELPDMIILDQNMPKMNGLQTLQLLKESAQYKDIPVMIYSTYADHHLAETCTRSGALIVVSKPVSKEGYNVMMNDFLELVNG